MQQPHIRPPRLLLMVHVEQQFRASISDDLLQRLVAACRSGLYQRIVHLTDIRPLDALAAYSEQIPFGFDYAPGVFGDTPEEEAWIINHHGNAYAWVPPQFRDAEPWRAYRIDLAGGGVGSCLIDVVAMLDYLDIPYQIRPDQTYAV